MAMALIYRAIGRDAIEILFTVDVVQPDTLGMVDHQVERRIVVRAIVLIEIDKRLCFFRISYMHDPRVVRRVCLLLSCLSKEHGGAGAHVLGTLALETLRM